MKAVILLGGFGTRLRPFTCTTPKPLLPILNRPSVMYQIELLRKNGIRDIAFCLNYLSKNFLKYFGDGRKFGIRIKYFYEKMPLGTGGAIKNVQEFIDTPTVIFNGDILTDINIGDVIKSHKSRGAALTIVLTRVKDPTVYGLVETNRQCRIERFLEKPSWDEITCNTINAGIYVFDPSILEHIPPRVNYSVERGLFPLLLEMKYPVYGYISSSYWIDIGTVEKYLQVHHDILSGNTGFTIPGRRIRKNIWADRGVRISPDSAISGSVVIGKGSRIDGYVQISGTASIGGNCLIGKGATINDSVILDNTVIGEGARIEKSVIGNNCVMGVGCSVGPLGAIGDNTTIARFSRT
ncbi:MAG: NDP-sugar synthase [Elusimicrobiota bacterium]